jgi:predicted dehydrogenase
MIKSIRFGLIGVGGIGSYHRAAINKLEARGAARLVAVADPWVERLAPARDELLARGVHWHLDYRAMLETERDLDAVVIATPIPFHYEMTMACLRQNLYVHLEKPPVPLLQQLDALIGADSAQAVSVGFQFIGSRCMQTLKRLIADGELGKVREIRAAACWPRSDRYYSRANWAGKMMLGAEPVFDGPATNALAHVIQNIMYLAADGLNDFAAPEEVEGELYRARPIESYDTACLRGRFGNSVEFSVAVTHATETAMPFCIEVRGSKGWARLSEDGARLETHSGFRCDHPENTQELIHTNYANFVDVLNGRADRFTTRLVDTRGYVSTTNAMLASSGGVHTVNPASVRRYAGGGTGGFEVLRLREAIQESLTSGRLLGEQGYDWATARPKPYHFQNGDGVPFANFESLKRC